MGNRIEGNDYLLAKPGVGPLQSERRQILNPRVSLLNFLPMTAHILPLSLPEAPLEVARPPESISQEKKEAYAEKYRTELDYIHSFWGEMVTTTPEDPNNGKLINPGKSQFNLPYAYIAVNKGRWGDPKAKDSIQFNWDNTCIIPALVDDPEYRKIAVGIIGNFDFMLDTIGIIPNGSSVPLSLNSQPPLYTSMALSIFESLPDQIPVVAKGHTGDVEVAHDKYAWLADRYKSATKEHDMVWVSDTDFEPALGKYHHRVPGTLLSKYGDRDGGYALNAERESGWDLTDRFGNRCNEFLPIDLNSYLFKYEKDLGKIATILAERESDLAAKQQLLDQASHWHTVAEQRREEVNKLMWDEEQGFFFDFNFLEGGMSTKTSSELTAEEIAQGRSPFYSLAGFMPVWAGLATPEQSARVFKKLGKFESEEGLAVSALESMPQSKLYDLSTVNPFYRRSMALSIEEKQWGYPNIFPILEAQVAEAAVNAGYPDIADSIRRKALASESRMFEKYKDPQTGESHGFAEKRRVDGKVPPNYHYVHQKDGFGWTCGTFYSFVKALDKAAKK